MVIHTRSHVFITRSVGNWGLWALRVITVVNCVLTVVNITVIYVFHTPKQIFRTSSIASITEFMNKQDKQYQSILSSIQSLKTNIEEHKKTSPAISYPRNIRLNSSTQLHKTQINVISTNSNQSSLNT